MLRAIKQIRRMRVGAQAHLMRGSDENYYVVKFQNNPQHRRVLVNGTYRLCEYRGGASATRSSESTAVTMWRCLRKTSDTVLYARRCSGVEAVAMEGFAVWAARMRPMI